jgi:adenylate kinase
VLDGVPRTIAQAWVVYRIAHEMEMTADIAPHLHADDDELRRRLRARGRRSSTVPTTPRRSSIDGWSSTAA